MSGIFDSVQEWWARGRADPLQFVDSITPGNWRQGNQFNREGLIAGVGQVATGMPAALTQPLISRMLGGQQSPGTVPRINALRSNQAAGVPRIDSVIPANEQGRSVRDEVNPRVGSGDSSAPVRGGPSFGGNNMTAHSGPGGTISSQRGLGLGQLGRGGDESLAAFAASLFSRGGTQSEQ